MVKVDSSVASYVDAYVAGWARSRGARDPERVDLGWYIPTGPLGEPERYVLTSGTVDDVRQIQARLTEPGSGIKFAGTRSEWLFLVDAEWAENPIGWFMAADIGVGAAPDPPLGTVTEAQVRDQVALVEVRYGDQVIASGQAGLADEWTVPDRILTAAAFRRRGLGRFVMRRLLRLASVAGARRAVLSASVDGRELYHAMGWRTVAGQFNVVRRPAQ